MPDPNQDDLFNRIRMDAAHQANGTTVGPVMGVPGMHGVPQQQHAQHPQPQQPPITMNGRAPMPSAGISGVAGISGLARLGELDASGHGVTVTMPGAGGHVLTVALAALSGAGLGGAAAGNLRGAAIGASGNLAMVGLVNAIFGKGFTGIGGRVAYGILGAFGLSATAWLMVRRSRGR